MQAPFEAIFTQIAEIKCSQERLESEMRRCMHDLKYFIGMKLEDVEARQKVMQVDQAVRHQDAEAKLTVLERAIQHVLASMEGQFVAFEYNSIARAYNSLHSRRATLLPIKNGNNVAYPNFPFNVAEFMAATDNELISFARFYNLNFSDDMQSLRQKILCFIGLDVFFATQL